MSDLTKLYVVTSGTYSDYHIEAIFKDETKARIYCILHEDCEIEEYDTNDETFDCEGFDMTRIGFEYSRVFVIKKDALEQPVFIPINKFGFNKRGIDLLTHKTRIIKNNYPTCYGYGADTITVYITTRDELTEDRLNKIAFDMLAQYKSEQM